MYRQVRGTYVWVEVSIRGRLLAKRNKLACAFLFVFCGLIVDASNYQFFMSNLKTKLFGEIDFSSLSENNGYNETMVCQNIINPILQELGYKNENIIREKPLKDPYLTVGRKRQPITTFADYAIKVDGCFPWVLEAKSPKESILDDDKIAQAYSYAKHIEINSTYFALCNGVQFVIFRTNSIDRKPILVFDMDSIDEYFATLKNLLSPDSFSVVNTPTLEIEAQKNNEFDYANRPLLKEIVVKKRASKIHFGVHGYFTKQAWNVVQQYVKNYTRQGDLVLDPFGGSGVTAIEALMLNRRAINIDINPLAVFLVKSLVAPVSIEKLKEAFEKVKKEYLKYEPHTADEIAEAIKKYPQPKPIPLPKGSDVADVTQLFSPKQLAQLSLLKYLICKQKDKNIKNVLLLMFSGLITRINLTFHVSKTGGSGDAAAFRYYRYRIAPEPTILDVMNTFELRYDKVIVAKKEIEKLIDKDTIHNIDIRKGTATDLSFLQNESVDYIYTDPPYGNKIAYLDLSIMWNAWLDFEVTEDDYEAEAIEGGQHNKTKENYKELIAKSIREMYRVLKFDRYLSFVFAHKDPEFWHLIVDTAEECGFEYVGAVPQKNGQSSFKKRQNPFTVLSGQLIINFRKSRNPRAIMKANLGMEMSDIIITTIEGVIAKNDGATLEQINDELILKGLELGFLCELRKEYSDLTPLLRNSFDYDKQTEKFHIIKNTKFTSHIDVHLRIRYFLTSYLKRMAMKGENPTFDQIVLDILPLLKNGTTPEKQTILNVLENIAQRTTDGRWQIRKSYQSQLEINFVD